LALGFGQPGQSIAHLAGPEQPLSFLVDARAERVARLGEGDRGALTAEVVDGAAVSDGEQPRLERPAVVVGRARPPQLEEAELNQVVDLIGADVAAQLTAQGRLEEPVAVAEGVGVASGESLRDRGGVGGVHGPAGVATTTTLSS
jgi:hypothetical protein